MANDDDPVDKLRPVAHPPTDLPAAETPVPRLGQDDVVGRHDAVDGAGAAVPGDDPGDLGGAQARGAVDDRESVEVPVEVGRPFSRAAKRRNQRRLPS
ncbi:hypothetical protein [Plantactinospora sp. B5E13]|uniref:hypothetical protein n=1 Tax=unclassified Plantactinospora TaxID=2631981 RepID=UPI00325DE76F